MNGKLSKSAITIATLGSLIALAFALTPSPASAAGCNGYVNQAVWGCAIWDNNNGPQFPHYVPPRPAPRAVVAPARPVLAPRPTTPVVRSNGNGLVATGGGNLITNDGATLVGPSGGTMRR
jgi:hypothetical protein